VLPVALGGFLALLAIGAVGHALTTVVPRRAHDLAVLRALGLTRAQAGWVATAQASVYGFAGLLADIPLGLAAGRALWRAAAGLIPVYYQPPAAPWVLLLIGPAVLACVLALALIPGGRAARLPIARCCTRNDPGRYLVATADNPAGAPRARLPSYRPGTGGTGSSGMFQDG